jgi:hypothetical protein
MALAVARALLCAGKLKIMRRLLALYVLRFTLYTTAHATLDT